MNHIARITLVLAGMLLGLPIALAVSSTGSSSTLRDAFSREALRTLASMRLTTAPPRAPDPSNAYEARADAAALGRELFNDMRFSRNGKVSCASCHSPQAQFEDGRPQGLGVGLGKRRTMPVMGAAGAPFLFWDGRKDSLWSQALGPMEDGAEHGGNRVRFIQVLRTHYAAPYQALFGPLPDPTSLPEDASPQGSPAERAAWAALPPAKQDDVNRAFSNMGKAIAAYEAQVRYGASRFDRYAQATLDGDAGAQQAAMSEQEVRGLRLFIGPGQCVTCHNGPMLTDHAFHNTGVPPLNPKSPDRGRADAIRKLMADEFNCLGRYSDARPGDCGELTFLSTEEAGQVGAFRTPSLRNVVLRAPYMHAGQFGTLPEALRHYAESPEAAVGRSELARPGERHPQRQVIRLSTRDVEDLAAFLGALSGPVVQP